MGILRVPAGFKNITSRLTGESLTKKASLNAMAAVIDYVVRIVVELTINPILVSGLGAYGFGLWRILWRTSGYLLAAGGRSAQALLWVIAKQQASDDYDEKRQQIGNAVMLWVIFLPLLSLIGGLLVWQVPVWFDVPGDYVWSAQVTTALLMVNIILISLTDIPWAVLRGENLGYKRMGLSSLLVLVGGCLTALVTYLGFGIIGMAAVTIVTTLLSGALFLQVVYKHVPWFGIRMPTRQSLRWFLGLSWWFTIWKLVTQLMLAGDIVVLGMFGSVTLVTTYTLTKYIPEALIQLVATFVVGVAPGLGGIIGAGDFKKANQVRTDIMAFTWLLCTMAGAVILLWNHAFVRLWVGGQYDAGPYAALLIVIMMIQLTIIRNDANIIDLTLDVRTKSLLGLFSSLLSLILAAVLVSQFQLGIAGLCAGIILGRLPLTVAYPRLIGKVMGIPFIAQVKGMVRPLVVTTLLFILAFVLRDYWTPNHWIALVFYSGISVLFFGVIAMWLGLTAEQRLHLLQRLASATGLKLLRIPLFTGKA